MCIYFEVITLIKLVNTSFTAHNYQGFCLIVIIVSIFEVCTPSHSQMKSTVLLTIVIVNRQDQLRGTQSKIIGIWGYQMIFFLLYSSLAYMFLLERFSPHSRQKSMVYRLKRKVLYFYV